MRAVLVAMVAVGLVLAALVWWSRGESSAPVQRPDLGPPPAAGSRAVPDASPSPAPIPSPSSAGDAASAASSTRRAVAPPTDVAPGNVRVVSRGGEPVADAAVCFDAYTFDWSALPRDRIEALQRLRATDEVAYFRQVGGEVRTRSDGTCTVPVGEHLTSVMAQAGDLYATGVLRADAAEPLELRLRVDRALRVRVLTLAGRPAEGVQVVGVGTSDEGSPDARRFAIGASDAEGLVVLPHCQLLAGDAAAFPLRLRATAAGVAGEPVEVDVVAPPEEVVLRLPPCGVVTVRMFDADGAPLDPGYLPPGQELRLTVFADEQAMHARTTGLRSDADGLRAAIDTGGRAVFAHVPLDRFVVVRMGHFGMEARAVGPTAAVPTVEVVLREGDSDVVLTGTLATPSGQPVAGEPFSVSYRTGGGFGSGGGTTDRSGRFRCNIGGFAADERCRLTFRAGSRLEPGGESVELAERELRRGRNDLGVVQLAAETTLLAGRLVRGEGVPALRAQLEIERQQDGRWNRDWTLRPEWSGDGAFAVRGAAPVGEPLRLVVGEGPYLPVEPIECRAGDTSIEIPLRAAGAITATFLVDDGVPVHQLVLRCERIGADPEPDLRRRMFESLRETPRGPAQEGRFAHRWTGLAPGRYRLTVHCRGSDLPIVDVPALDVPPGECADPRLAAIDLRGRLRVLEIRAIAADGAPVVDDASFVLARGGADESPGYHLGRGVARVLASGAVDLVVFAAGHEAAVVEAVTESRSIPLRPAREAELLVGLPGPLPDGARLELELTPRLDLPRGARVMLDTGRGMGLSSMFVERAVVDENGRAVVPVRFPGTHSVVGRITGSRLVVRGFTPSELVLPGEGVVRIAADPARLQRAIDERGR